MEIELGEWDNLVIGHSHDEIEQRQRALDILKCMEITGETYPDYIQITKNLREKDPSGLFKLGNKF
jgi:hypothetical protein